jgi:hypothetical protein
MKKLLGVPALRKSQLNNARRTSVLVTNDLTGTGLPAAGIGGTKYDLPIVFSVPIATGLLTLTTNIELERSSATWTKWQR